MSQTRQPRRVLYAWEWGAGSGHVQRFLPIAEAVSQNGDDVVWVLKEMDRLKSCPTRKGYQVVHCPQLKPCRCGDAIPPRNLAAITWNLGYHDADRLVSVVRDWLEIFIRTRPDLVVQDFGATAGMIARSIGIRTMRIGTGYTCPPRRELPVDLPWFAKRLSSEELQNSPSNSFANCTTSLAYEKVMDRIAAACRVNGLSVPSRWDEVVEGCEDDILATLPLLDPYAAVRASPTWDGVWVGRQCLARVTDDNNSALNSESAAVLAYLKPFAHWKQLFAALKQLRVRVDLVADGVSENLLQQCDPAWVRICDGFRSIEAAAAGEMTLINNGNHGSTALSLLHGMPVIACPLFFEQRLTAEAIEEAGVGTFLDVRYPDRFMETLRTGLQEERFRARAKRFEERHASLFRDQSAAVLDRLNRQLG